MSEEKQLAVFQFNGMEVRTQVINNEPMFCLSDVCKVLEIGTPSNVKTRLNQGGIDTINTPTSSGIQPMTFITEQNLYKVIFQSRKPEAEKFTDWVTGEVLPSIRKTGGYIGASAEMTDDVIMTERELNVERAIEVESALGELATKMRNATSFPVIRDGRGLPPRVLTDADIDDFNRRCPFRKDIIAKFLRKLEQSQDRRVAFDRGVRINRCGIYI